MTREDMIDMAVRSYARKWANIGGYDYLKMLRDWADWYSWGMPLHDGQIRAEFRHLSEINTAAGIALCQWS